jgi:TIR domain
MNFDIDDDALAVLKALDKARNGVYVEPDALAATTGLAPERLNDVIRVLLQYGLVDEAASFLKPGSRHDFSPLLITSRGKLAAHRLASATPLTAKTGGSLLKLFISHASADAVLARKLINLIERALALPSDQIRCSSVDGYRLPAGADTNTQIRRETLSSEAFIGLISGASLESMYVLFELGARWGTEKSLTPLVAKGSPGALLKQPLSGLNALSANNRSQLHQLVKDLAAQLSVPLQSAAVYTDALEDVLAFTSSPPALPVAPPTVAVTLPGLAATTATEPAAPESLTADALKLLSTLYENDEVDAEDLADLLSASKLKIEVALEDLTARGFVSANRAVGRPDIYTVTAADRKALSESRTD